MRHRLAAFLPFAVAAAVVAFLLRRMRARGGDAPAAFEAASRAPREDAGAPPSDAPAAETVDTSYTCECGTEYRVSGEGRHRVYWKADAAASDPVIGGACLECERPLPGHHPAEGDTSGGDAAEGDTSGGDAAEAQTSDTAS